MIRFSFLDGFVNSPKKYRHGGIDRFLRKPQSLPDKQKRVWKPGGKYNGTTPGNLFQGPFYTLRPVPERFIGKYEREVFEPQGPAPVALFSGCRAPVDFQSQSVAGAFPAQSAQEDFSFFFRGRVLP